jgi:MFS family permease
VRAPSAEEPTGSLWRNRDFQLLWSGQVVSVLGGRVSSIAVPLLALDLTHSAAAAAITQFAGQLPLLVFSLPAGAILDRTNRKVVMVVCELVRGLAFGSVVVALWAGVMTFPHLVGMALVNGTGFVLFDVAQRSIIRQVVRRPHLAAAFAQTQAREFLSLILGPPLGGVLYAAGRLLPFLVNSVSFLASVGSVGLMRTRFQEARAPGSPTTSVLHDVREGVVWLARNPFLRATTLALSAATVLLNALFFALLVISREHGATAAQVGLMLGLLGVGGLLGTLVSTWIVSRLPPGLVLVGGMIFPALLCPLFLLASTPLEYGVLLLVLFFAQPPVTSVIGPYRVTLVPDRLQGRVSSVVSLVNLGGIPLGTLAVGFVLQWWGGQAAIAAIAGGMAIAALASLSSASMRHPPPLTAAG